MTIRNDTVVIAGNIGNDPSRGVTRTGKPVINFRVASTPGYFDQRTGAWVEGDTSWYAVSAFGNIAEHAKASLHCGDPVIVVGRMKVREWEANGKKGVDVEIDADAIGHDLNKGTSAFARRARTGSAEQAVAAVGAPEAAASGTPDDDGMTDEPSAAERASWDAEGMIDPDADPSSTEADREGELAYT
jgi:single-strand DNA-binding protein